MTLLEMIKKWEGVKDDLESQNIPGTRIKGDKRAYQSAYQKTT